MRVGLYSLPVPADIGGGFVLRDDILAAAENFSGQHRFEHVAMPARAPITTRVKMRINRLTGRSSYANTAIAAQLSREVVKRKLDLLWFNDFEPVQVGVPYILSIFDLQHRLQPGFPEVSAGREWERRELRWRDATRRASMIVVGSSQAKEQVCRFYGIVPENVFVLPFPTPQRAIDRAKNGTGAPTADVRKKYAIQNDFLFYPAQFWPHKNHANLLHALRILKERDGKILSLLFTGSDQGNRRHVERLAAELDLNGQVRFCGFVPYEDILSLYSEARALTYVSFFGPENLPPLEAMALGCPVIMSDIAGARTLHGDGPVYVNARSPEAIANAVSRLLTDPDDVRARVNAGRDLALRNDSLRYMDQFQQMLDEYAPVRRCWP